MQARCSGGSACAMRSGSGNRGGSESDGLGAGGQCRARCRRLARPRDSGDSPPCHRAASVAIAGQRARMGAHGIRTASGRTASAVRGHAREPASGGAEAGRRGRVPPASVYEYVDTRGLVREKRAIRAPRRCAPPRRIAGAPLPREKEPKSVIVKKNLTIRSAYFDGCLLLEGQRAVLAPSPLDSRSRGPEGP